MHIRQEKQIQLFLSKKRKRVALDLLVTGTHLEPASRVLPQLVQTPHPNSVPGAFYRNFGVQEHPRCPNFLAP